ncbi:MAG: hypothetical protein RL169_1894 [Armatimonadota bacterium]
MGGVRLDQAIDAATAAKLASAVTHTGKSKMPPSGPIPVAEQKALRDWVAGGAPWPAGTKPVAGRDINSQIKAHWAFQPVRLPALPKVKDAAWAMNPIDRFTLAKMEAAGIKPSKPADRRTLIRRATYDLTGLPPSPEEVRAFEADTAPDAYARLIDRLLASKHYGEKWGRHWLDLVRFAETNSYERDNPKPNAFRFRDYVIKSMNDDKPFDVFMREQLAGDEMPNPTADQLTATGFYRLGIWDDEPTDPELARYDGMDDLITTVGQTFLGLTMDCARCHNHKIDPIPQADYYRFLSFFQGINHFRNGGPTDEKPIFDTVSEKARYDAEVAAFDARRDAGRKRLDALQAAYGNRRDKDAIANGDLSDVRWVSYASNGNNIPDISAAKPTGSGVLKPALFDVAPARGKGNIAIVYDATLSVPQAGKATFFLDSDDASRLYIDGKVVIDYDGSHGEGAEKKAEVDLSAGKHAIRIAYVQGDAGSPLGLSAAWSLPGFGRRPLTVWASTSALGQPVQRAYDLKRFVSAGELAEQASIEKLLDDNQTKRPSANMALVVTEGGPNPRETNILLRGIHTSKGEKVEPGYPVCTGGITPPLDEPAPGAPTSGRRTALAQWITGRENVMTRRVLANRIWQYHFGRGIVRSANNFGLAGDKPTHPELLDYLAETLDWNGWSLKDMHRLIMTSNTYMQDSALRPDAQRKDSLNDLFHRFDMRRLQAEEIRDSILAVSGLLNPEMYGPSVYPDIDKDVLKGQSIPGKDWYPERNTPQQKNRRSIYVFVKRSLLYPLLEAFDLAETDRTTPMRYASTQPTQALTMMNSTIINQAGKGLAVRIAKEGHVDVRDFARRALSLTMQRTPTETEITKLVSLGIRFELRGATEQQAKEYLCLLALNLNEFVYLD